MFDLGLVYYIKVEKVLKGSLDLIPSPSVKSQIMGWKVCLRCKGETFLGVVNKLFVFKCLLTSSSNVLPIIWISKARYVKIGGQWFFINSLPEYDQMFFLSLIDKISMVDTAMLLLYIMNAYSVFGRRRWLCQDHCSTFWRFFLTNSLTIFFYEFFDNFFILW